ncbi:MAG: CBS domain-containing protein [Polyangiaceae bacterium]|nr:CBS domain-containing protein [Polyangiaceae bacterium]
MTESPHTIGSEQTLAMAHTLMREHSIRHLPVLHGGQLAGMVTVRDLHLVETLKDVEPDAVRVEEAMTPDPYVVAPSALLRDVAAEMAERKLGSAIVVDGKKVVGVFTTVDALRALVEAIG